jgi:hypothetical protein
MKRKTTRWIPPRRILLLPVLVSGAICLAFNAWAISENALPDNLVGGLPWANLLFGSVIISLRYPDLALGYWSAVAFTLLWTGDGFLDYVARTLADEHPPNIARTAWATILFYVLINGAGVAALAFLITPPLLKALRLMAVVTLYPFKDALTRRRLRLEAVRLYREFRRGTLRIGEDGELEHR